jgi:hypothetical protein
MLAEGGKKTNNKEAVVQETGQLTITVLCAVVVKEKLRPIRNTP